MERLLAEWREAREALGLTAGSPGSKVAVELDQTSDVVEVSPPLDPSGVTALNGATLLFEILCLLSARLGAR